MPRAWRANLTYAEFLTVEEFSQLAARNLQLPERNCKPKHLIRSKVFLIMTRIADTMVTLVNNQNYATEIHHAVMPVLLLCMPKGPDFSDQSILLHKTAEKYQDAVKVCLLEEELINGFRQMLHIKGTPVYLLFFKGGEKGRMLGLVREEQLTAFLLRHLPNPDRDSGEESSWQE